MNQNQEKEESLAVLQARSKLQEMVEGMLKEISGQTPVRKSSSDQTNFVIFPKSLLDRQIHFKVSNEKYEMQLSLELSKLPSRTSDT